MSLSLLIPSNEETRGAHKKRTIPCPFSTWGFSVWRTFSQILGLSLPVKKWSLSGLSQRFPSPRARPKSWVRSGPAAFSRSLRQNSLGTSVEAVAGRAEDLNGQRVSLVTWVPERCRASENRRIGASENRCGAVPRFPWGSSGSRREK